MLEIISELKLGKAIYQIIDEGSGSFLLGLGLWDRANEPHTLEIKNRTKGQVIRVDEDDNILDESPELSNIIYQLMPIDNERIFVGCRNGELQYLNQDLSLRKKIDFENKGLYFWVRDNNTIVATMREGGILFYDIDTEKTEIVKVVDPSIRMWPIAKDGNRYITGSYKGHLAILEDRKVIKKIKVDEKTCALWTVDRFDDKYLVGTSKGDIFTFDNNLENRELVYKNKYSITSTAILGPEQIAVADLKGNIYLLDSNGNVISYEHPVKEKTDNTIWWMTPDLDKDLMRVAYSNGQMRTFRLE